MLARPAKVEVTVDRALKELVAEAVGWIRARSGSLESARTRAFPYRNHSFCGHRVATIVKPGLSPAKGLSRLCCGSGTSTIVE